MSAIKWLSKLTGGRPKDTPPGENTAQSEQLGALPEDLPGLREVIAINCKDITELVTAVNRIERKQNRWIELLNMRDEVKAAETVPDNGAEAAEGLANLEAVASSPPPNLPGGAFPGMETE